MIPGERFYDPVGALGRYPYEEDLEYCERFVGDEVITPEQTEKIFGLHTEVYMLKVQMRNSEKRHWNGMVSDSASKVIKMNSKHVIM